MIGRVVGNYRIEALVGQGGMARVFRARHTSLDRVVAIKALRPDLAADPAVRERIVQEQRALDLLRHPAIVGLYDVHVEGAELFLVMEYVEGESLKERLDREGPMDAAAACGMAEQILSGLCQAHAAGVIHRDVKPANVMLTAETAKLVDFGVARAADAAAVTATGMVVGSPAYLPPERWEASPATPATDVYGVGLCLWEALAGRPAVPAEAGWKTCYKAHTVHGIPDVRTASPEVPAWLAEVVAQATRKDPEARYADARAMLDVLRASGGAANAVFEEQRTVQLRVKRQPNLAGAARAQPAQEQGARGVAKLPVPREPPPLAASPERLTPPVPPPAPAAATPTEESPVAPAPSHVAPPARPAAVPPPAPSDASRWEPGDRTRAMTREAARDLARSGGPSVDPETWQPGEMTRAFLRRARRPWKRLVVAIVLAGALVGAGLVVRAIILARAVGSGFSLELANIASSPIHIACTAGEGDDARSWSVNVAPDETANIGIPLLPATCEEVKADGSRQVVWTMPRGVAVGEVLPEITQEDEEVRPQSVAEAPAPTAKKPVGRTASPKPKAQEVTVSRLVVGEPAAAPPPPSICTDLVALEPLAMLGQLPPDAAACLEASLAGNAPLTTKDHESRILIWDAEARHDRVAWERLVRRHLATIDRSDPDMCMALAIRLRGRSSDVALEESIELASFALENRSRYEGDTFVQRVNALHALRTTSAEAIWRHREEAYTEARTAETEDTADIARHRTRDYAREWLEYAHASGQDVSHAQAIVAEVGGARKGGAESELGG